MAVSVRIVLVALDLGPGSPKVCAYAAELANRFGARIHALHVLEEIEGLKGINLPRVSYDELVPELENRGRAKLAQLVATHLKGVRDVKIDVARGRPYARILECANELPADLIVMATHGRTGLDRAIFGSTAERVVRAAAVPVMVVPAPE